MLYLTVDLRVHFKNAFEGAFVSATEDPTEGSSERPPRGVLWDRYKDVQEIAFEFEIKGALEVTIELHLNMRILVHFLGHRNAQNDSIKSWTWEGTLCCTGVQLRFHFRQHLKMPKNVNRKMHFMPSSWSNWQSNQGVDLRVRLMGHKRMHLAISKKMHKRVHVRLQQRVLLRLHLSCACACTFWGND